MALFSLLDDLSPPQLGSHRHRRRSRPFLTSLLNSVNLVDSLEDQVDQQVGYIFRRLPSLLMGEGEDGPMTKRRKMDKTSQSEPKSKAVISSKDNKFQIQLSASSFSPEELTVKVAGDKVIVSGKHESKGNDVYEFHEMYRSFDVPEGVDPDAITSRLSASGQLTIEAPIKALKEAPAERILPIEREEEKPTKEPLADQETQTKPEEK